MGLRIRTILGDPAVVAQIEAALRRTIAGRRPDTPKGLRDFLEDDKGSLCLPPALTLARPHRSAAILPPEGVPRGRPAPAPQAARDGPAADRHGQSAAVLEEAASP